MAAVPLFTLNDAISHVTDYLGSELGEMRLRHARRAVQAAYRRVTSEFRWSYYYQRGRIATVAPYKTGTIAYKHAGGTVDRQVTLTGGTWPAWAGFGVLLAKNISYQVAERISDSVLQLSNQSNPGADLAAGTTYDLFRDTYPLPTDFVAADNLVDIERWYWPSYVDPGEWLARYRASQSPGTPWVYSFFGDENYIGTLAVKFWQPPDLAYNFDMIYQRRPKRLQVEAYKTGTVSITKNTKTVTGTGTAFKGDHVGSSIRISSDGKTDPTGLEGDNPYIEERVIFTVVSPTECTVDEAWTQTASSRKFLVSDPIDVEEGTMMTAFLRCCEAEVDKVTIRKTRDDSETAYQRAMIAGREMDSRSFAARVAGPDYGLSYSEWLRKRPIGADKP